MKRHEEGVHFFGLAANTAPLMPGVWFAAQCAECCCGSIPSS